MATGTVYLDVDDEITSAAARIRGSEATKVALVIPYGSRIATSRMNFRLLSREALVNNRRLSIVATDPATRALAASAGLPVFANVAEWEAATEPTAEPEGGESVAAAAPAMRAAAAPGPSAADEPSSADPADDATRPVPTRSRKKGAAPTPDDAPTLGLPAAVATGAGAAATRPAMSPPITPASSGPGRPETSSPARLPVVKSRSLPRIGAPAALIAGALALAIVVAGVGAYVFLPSATIVVTPREEGIGPIALVVRADPNATAPDATSNVVPATVLEVPVDVTETFETIGRRVAETPAAGGVTFRNVDFTATNTVPAGSLVSTQGGVRFKTDRAVTVPKATLVGLQVAPAFADVSVTAETAGVAGNVEPNTITVIPGGEDPVTLSVRNQRATTGGTHEEFPQIQEAEVTAAVEALTARLGDAFTAAIDAGAGAPANATVFPETAVLGEAAPTIDPATLVGMEEASFELEVAATGTVTAVDSSPVVKIAETRLLANVGADHRLVEGSIEIVPGEPTVANGVVSFPVTAKASRVRILDPDALLGMVKGRSVDEARSILSQFGEVQLDTWPAWVSTISGLDSRLSLEVAGQGGEEDNGDAGPSSSALPSTTPRSSPTARPSAASPSPTAASPAVSAQP